MTDDNAPAEQATGVATEQATEAVTGQAAEQATAPATKHVTEPAAEQAPGTGQHIPTAQPVPETLVSGTPVPDVPVPNAQTSEEDAEDIGPQRDAIRALERELLGSERTMKRREVAAGAGVSLLSARKLWRAMGFPNFGDDDVAFTPRDMDALITMLSLVREGVLTEEATISITRSLGQMTDRMVVWQVEALVEDIVAQRQVSDAMARKMVVEELPRLLEPLEEMMVYAWRRQMTAGVQRLAVRAASGLAASEQGREGDEDDAPLPLARAVGFADLVSYTSLSRRMNEKTLAQLVQRFEQKCAEIISVGGGRLVKTIGDEVLFNAETPAAGAEISLALARAFREDDQMPDARVSMVWGRVLSRLGDIYGPTVNLAARLTALAEPGTVLVEATTAAALASDERFVLVPQKMESVRGFGEIHPVVLARGRGEGLVLD